MAATLTGFEGVRLKAYPDPATGGKPWTICMGDTNGVKRGDIATLAECKQQLYDLAPKYIKPLEACLKVPVPDKRLIALTSLAWNLGPGVVCGSSKKNRLPSVAELLNAGKVAKACDAFLRYSYAAGIYFPGLHTRRVKERAMCLEPIGPKNPVE
ncbi:lysozyme [Mesorhizobium sp.]|uniref:lysozyme n=1 Tax=Mesorhizobium sp. TaxID=1871066 RepID=UPI0025EAE543|nr:lysozyme [Mesorhizobium sp.]